jgi:hypothetical protein
MRIGMWSVLEQQGLLSLLAPCQLLKPPQIPPPDHEASTKEGSCGAVEEFLIGRERLRLRGESLFTILSTGSRYTML